MTQAECERLLRFYRGYYLLYDADGRWLRHDKRRKLMDDESIRAVAEEFTVVNRMGPLVRHWTDEL